MAPLREKKEKKNKARIRHGGRKAAKASGRQELQKLNARDLSAVADRSGPQFLCGSASLREEKSAAADGRSRQEVDDL